MNWQEIAQQDQALRAGVENASEALARHRWENTIQAGVSFREYARKCGVHPAAVHRYARAYELSTSSRQPISEALVRATASVDQVEVLEAVAEARGLTLSNVQKGYADEVRRIRSIAKARSEAEGTSIREEADKLAQMRVRRESADASIREAAKARTDLRYMELEKYLLAARRNLKAAMSVDVDFDPGMTQLLVDSLNSVRKLIDLVDMKLSGAADVDWDSELAKLGVQE